LISAELSRAFGKAMKDIRKKGNFKQLEEEILKAKSLDDLSEECKQIVNQYIN
jgi:hypothetical protein